MRRLNNIFDWFIYSNLLIAFSAAAQVVLSYCILNIPFNIYVVLLEWSSTLLLYNFSLWLSMPKAKGTSPYPRTQWYFKYKYFNLSLSVIAFLIFGYSSLQLHSYLFMLLGLIAFLSLGYSLPIIHSKKGYITLRQVVGLKVFLIALVWSLSAVGLPVVEYIAKGGVVDMKAAVIWAALVFMFILGITLPFDIRDMKQDALYNLKTLPHLIGEQSSKRLCYLLISLHSLCIITMSFYPLYVTESLLIIDLFVILLFYTSLFRKNINYNDVYLLDLILIIQALLVVVW